MLYGIKKSNDGSVKITPCRAKDPEHCPYHTKHVEWSKQEYQDKMEELLAPVTGNKLSKMSTDGEYDEPASIIMFDHTILDHLEHKNYDPQYDMIDDYRSLDTAGLSAGDARAVRSQAENILADRISANSPVAGDSIAMELIEGDDEHRGLGRPFAMKLLERMDDLSSDMANDLITYDLSTEGDEDHAVTMKIIKDTGRRNKYGVHLHRIVSQRGDISDPIVQAAVKKIDWSKMDLDISFGDKVWDDKATRASMVSRLKRLAPKNVSQSLYVDLYDPRVKLSYDHKNELAGKLTRYDDRVTFLKNLDLANDVEPVRIMFDHMDRDHSASGFAFKSTVARAVTEGRKVHRSILHEIGFDDEKAAGVWLRKLQGTHR
jgi:hypothetical protein